ncbi:MAG: hypothetical protein ABIA47_03880 [bacterium]
MVRRDSHRKTREPHLRKGTKTREVFDLIADRLLEGVEEYFKAFQGRNWAPDYDYEELMAIKLAEERYARKRALKRLEKKEYIKLKKKGDKICIQLTEKGKMQKLKDVIASKEGSLPDGQVCVVSYDIPQKVAHVRWALRELLFTAGFRQIHRSVWEGDHDIVDEILALCKKLKVEDWIQIYVGERKTTLKKRTKRNNRPSKFVK